MKRSILVLFVSASCLAATAQTPDTTTQQQQFNNAPPDSTTATQQLTLGEMQTQVATDSLQITPVPVNTDVRSSDPMADTSSMRATGTTPVVPAENTPTPMATQEQAPVVPSVPATDQTVPQQQALQPEQMQANANTTTILPRGVNNPEPNSALLTGLGKWSALPILNTYVPEEIVNKLKSEHGDKLYDITMLKTGENQYGYSARIQENGVYSTVMINETVVANQ